VKIPFVGPFYEARSLNADAQRAVNCYLENDQSSQKAPVALYGTPGLLLRQTLGNAPIRGVAQASGKLYWVAGTSVYSMDTAYVVTKLGDIGTSAGRVGMAVNAAPEVLIVDGVAGWLVTGGALVQITDPDFPNGVTSATYQDGYFIVAGDGSRRLYWNATPDTGSAWNGTDFASAESSPDNVVAVYSDHREIWVFKQSKVEIWVNTGDVAQLFQRSGNTVMEQGCASAWTAQAMNNTMYWLGANHMGQGIVFSAQGYTPLRISTHALEHAMNGYSTLADAFSFCFQMEGHLFYVLCFPNADATWIFDAATQQWTEWAWRNPADNTLHRHRSNAYAFFNGEHIVGDWQTGKVYGMSLDYLDDAGDPILRLRRSQTQSDENKRLFFEQVMIEMDVGVGTGSGQGADPKVMLRYSNDGGNSWSNYKTGSLGKAGQYGRRVKFGPTGAGRSRVWELSLTDPVRFAVLGAEVNVAEGLM
jgi:hypothetical protein